MQKVFIVGVGPGSSEWVSNYVRHLVLSADILVGWEQDFKPVKELIKDQRIFLQECNNYLEVPRNAAVEAAKTGANIVVLKTGDPLVAPAGLELILKTFNGFQVNVVPGISTVQIAAAMACISLEGAVIITYHPLPHDGGRDLRQKRNKILSALSESRNLIVLTGVRQMPNQTARFLLDNGNDPNLACVVCEKLGLTEERITRCCLEDVAGLTFDWQSVLVIIS